MAIFFTFQQAENSCLFTTNVAARGLDFPGIHWVIQVDVPETPELYIHRVGRTARYISEGKSLIFVLPSELPFMDKLRK
jgi:superfamily II DNA/RNA helicase